MTNTEIAKYLYDNYQGLAEAFQLKKQKELKVEFEALPLKNRVVLLALADRINRSFIIIDKRDNNNNNDNNNFINTK